MRATLFAVVAVGLVACSFNNAVVTPDANPDAKPDSSLDAHRDGPPDAPSSHNITVTLKNRPNNGSAFGFLVAYQDGSGAWELAGAPSGDDYSFTVTSSSYGFGWTCIATSALSATANSFQVERYYFTVDERTNVTAEIPTQCTDRTPSAQLSGTVDNAPSALAAFFDIAQGGVGSGSAGPYAFPTRQGTRDLLVAHTGPSGATIDSVVVSRDVTVSGSTTAPTLDFGTAMATQTFPVTFSPPMSSIIQVKTLLFTANDTFAKLASISAAGGPFETVGLAAAQAQSGDVYGEQIAVTQGSATVFQQDWVASAAAQTYSPPAELPAPAATVPTETPYPVLQTTWSAYANAVGYNWTATQSLDQAQCGVTSGCTVVLGAQVSAGYAGTSPTDVFPDLSHLAGWDPRLQLMTGVTVDGSVTATTSTGGAADFPAATLLFPGVVPAAAGTSRTFAQSTWSATP